MSPKQLSVLQHALGVDLYSQGTVCRNYFAAGALDEVICRELLVLGFMEQCAPNSCRRAPYFFVTNEGISAMRRESPAPPHVSPVRKRYLEYLRFADACTCSFGEWLNIRATEQQQNMKAGA